MTHIIQALVSKQSDNATDHIVAFLAMRDDMSKSKVKQVCSVTLKFIHSSVCE